MLSVLRPDVPSIQAKKTFSAYERAKASHAPRVRPGSRHQGSRGQAGGKAKVRVKGQGLGAGVKVKARARARAKVKVRGKGRARVLPGSGGQGHRVRVTGGAPNRGEINRHHFGPRSQNCGAVPRRNK